MKQAAVRRNGQGAVLAVPAIVMMFVFFALPILAAIYIALTSWNGASVEMRFVGLANLFHALHDPMVSQALEHNAVWIVVGTSAPLILGIALALLLWNGTLGAALYRLIFFVPFVFPGVVLAIVWGWIYDPINGWLNRLLGDVGLSSFEEGWLGNPHTAIYAVMGAGLPTATGLVVVVVLAALQSVSTELIDAARIDGAGIRHRTLHIVLPQIAIPLTTVTTILLIGGFSVFDIVFIMTQGGPNGATDVLAADAYQNVFQFALAGYGTMLSLFVAILSLPFIFLMNFAQKRLRDAGMGSV